MEKPIEMNERQLSIIDTDKTLAENHRNIMARDGSKVFPISAPLRKKLENLKETSMGDIKTQLKFIKEQKYNQYLELNKERIDKLRKKIEKETENLSQKAYDTMRQDRTQKEKTNQKTSQQSQDFYKQVDTIHKKYPSVLKEYASHNFSLKESHNKPFKPLTALEKEEQDKRDKETFYLKLDDNLFINNVLKKEFDEQFGKGFEIATKKINDLERQFNESLLFGDMEVVKQVYYNLKKAEALLDDLNKIKFNKIKTNLQKKQEQQPRENEEDENDDEQ